MAMQLVNLAPLWWAIGAAAAAGVVAGLAVWAMVRPASVTPADHEPDPGPGRAHQR
jgi:hypothetical protein